LKYRSPVRVSKVSKMCKVSKAEPVYVSKVCKVCTVSKAENVYVSEVFKESKAKPVYCVLVPVYVCVP
jgi:hypothetical protein